MSLSSRLVYTDVLSVLHKCPLVTRLSMTRTQLSLTAPFVTGSRWLPLPVPQDRHHAPEDAAGAVPASQRVSGARLNYQVFHTGTSALSHVNYQVFHT